MIGMQNVKLILIPALLTMVLCVLLLASLAPGAWEKWHVVFVDGSEADVIYPRCYVVARGEVSIACYGGLWDDVPSYIAQVTRAHFVGYIDRRPEWLGGPQ